jgi:hypothetical protein
MATCSASDLLVESACFCAIGTNAVVTVTLAATDWGGFAVEIKAQ